MKEEGRMKVENEFDSGKGVDAEVGLASVG
jgi:hypothetical protein